MTKKCSKCKKIKNINEFPRDKYRLDGHTSQCKDCRNRKWKNYRMKNLQKEKRRWKNWYQINKSIRGDYGKNYRQENKDRLSIKRRQYYLNRVKKDKRFKFISNIRKRIRAGLNGKSKSLKSMFLIGCEVDYLMYHLQCQFKKGMTWDNYGYGKGKWVVDHIKPCASFDLTKKFDQCKCFHYTNLQPLWWLDNLKKGSKNVESVETK
ncbi:MAG: hypothetical protein ACTSWG_13240 [Candidatus Helarchaeota archaeon]